MQLVRIAAQHRDRPARDTAHLRKTRLQIRPLVNREGRHDGVETLVVEGQLFRHRVDRDRKMGRALRPHRGRRLDRRHHPVRRLVGTGTGADIQHGPGIAERALDEGGDMRIRLAVLRVIGADHAVIGVARTSIRMSVAHAFKSLGGQSSALPECRGISELLCALRPCLNVATRENTIISSLKTDKLEQSLFPKRT